MAGVCIASCSIILYIHVYICIYICVCVCARARVRACVRACVCVRWVYMHISENMWVNIRRRKFIVVILRALDAVPFASTPPKSIAVTTIKYTFVWK